VKTILERVEANLERKCRRQLAAQGYGLKKSRTRNTHGNDYGEYMIFDPYTNDIVAGEKFDMSLDEVVAFIKE
jgi:hypothetical protein